MTTATENYTTKAIRTAENVSVKADYAKSLLSTFIDQWDDLKRATEEDRKDGDQWRLVHEFERVHGRMVDLLNLTDELLDEIKQQDEAIIQELMTGQRTE